MRKHFNSQELVSLEMKTKVGAYATYFEELNLTLHSCKEFLVMITEINKVSGNFNIGGNLFLRHSNL